MTSRQLCRAAGYLCLGLHLLGAAPTTRALLADHPSRNYLSRRTCIHQQSTKLGECRDLVRIVSRSRSTRLSAISTTSRNSQSTKIPKSFRTEQQQRQQPKTRRPKFYWRNIENLEQELRDFWTHCGVDIHQHPSTSEDKISRKPMPLCIPNETLLHYFSRNDIIAAIVAYGGRDELAYKLLRSSVGATIMPGKWSDAVESSVELRVLLKNETLVDLSHERPPPAPQQRLQATLDKEENTERKQWSHQTGRKPLGYWSQQRVVEELYEYLDDYKDIHGRPSIWLPRPSELVSQGRTDLALAMKRSFGSTNRIAAIAGLVRYREWHFFEGQYELLVLLKDYLDEYGHKDYRCFPKVSNMRSRGYARLYLLIQYYGGAKFLSSRLGMRRRGDLDGAGPCLSWGQFSIEFAIRLSVYIRGRHESYASHFKAGHIDSKSSESAGGGGRRTLAARENN